MCHMQVLEWQWAMGIRGSALVVRMSVMTPRSGGPSTSARMSKSRVETTLIVFFDHRGFVHRQFVLEVYHSRPATSTRKTWDASFHESGAPSGVSGKPRTGCSITITLPGILSLAFSNSLPESRSRCSSTLLFAKPPSL